MASEKNILLDHPEETPKENKLGTLMDAAEVQRKQDNGLQTLFDIIDELHQKGEYEEMLSVVQEAMKLDPSNGNLVLLMGIVNRDLGKKIQAVHWLRKAVNDFGMSEAEPELMNLYLTGVAGADMKKKAEEYFGTQPKAAPKAAPAEVKATPKAAPKAAPAEVKATPKTATKAAPAEVKEAPKTEPEETKTAPKADLSKYPSPNTPLYTVEEHNEYLRKYPNMTDEQRLAIAEKDGRGFGYKYMSSVQTSVNSNDRQIWSDWNNLRLFAGQNEISGPTATETAKTLNSVNDFVRHEVAMKMQSYLNAHNGKVDCWPTSRTDFGFVANNIGDGTCVKLDFDYFANDFSVANEGEKRIISRQAGRKFRCGYSVNVDKAAKPKALQELESEIYKLERTKTYTSWDLFVSKVAMVISGLLFLMIGIPAILLVVAQMGLFGGFEGVDEIVDTFRLPGASSNMVMAYIDLAVTLIPILLWKIMGVISELAGMLNPGIGWFVTIVQALIAGVFSLVPFAFFADKTGFVTKKDQKEALEARNRAVELANGDEMKRLKQEYQKMRDVLRESQWQAESWHKKWFEACGRK